MGSCMGRAKGLGFAGLCKDHHPECLLLGVGGLIRPGDHPT